MNIFSKIAYHSTRQKGLTSFEDSTSDERIDTGEGAHVHGYGLYLQEDQQLNLENYFETLTYSDDAEELTMYFTESAIERAFDIVSKVEKGNLSFEIEAVEDKDYDCVAYLQGIAYYGTETDDIFSGDYMNSIVVMNWQDSEDGNVESDDEGLALALTLMYSTSEAYWLLENARRILHPEMTEAQQYKVEIPDDLILCQEGKTGNEQPETVKKILEDELFSLYGGSYEQVDNEMKEPFENILTDLHPEFDDDSKEQTEYLMSLGIDGKEYWGKRDGHCYVIFNCKDLTIVSES